MPERPPFAEELEQLFRWRRDVRHFRPDPLPPDLMDRLIATACLAPSVGLSEPWRFVTVDDPARRRLVRDSFVRCNAAALATQPAARADGYAALKLAALDEAPGHLAVFTVMDPEQGHGLGRGTMPETAAYSTVLALHTLWLAACAQGYGVGWVSILEPDAVAAALDVPHAWALVGYLCLGVPDEAHDTPELQRAGWEARRAHATRRVRR